MKKLLVGVTALLAGQLIVLTRKDKSFKKRLQKKEGMEKRKLIVDELVAFNKSLFEETKEKADSHLDKLHERFHKEHDKLQAKLTSLESSWKELSASKIKPMLTDAEQHLAQIKEKTDDLKDHPEVKEKIAELKKYLQKLKRRKI